MKASTVIVSIRKSCISRFIMSVQDPTHPSGGKIYVLICLYCSNCTKFARLISGKSLQLLPPDVRF